MSEEMTLKVFRLDSVEWWAAPTLEEAIQESMRLTGLSREEVTEDPCEISDDDMDKLTVRLDELDGEKVTFREALRLWVERGDGVGMFCSTEY